jgi:hypothetical protein
MAPWVFAGDEQRQLERVAEAQLGQVASGGQDSENVPSLARPLEDPVGVALRGRGLLLPGAETVKAVWSNASTSTAGRSYRG